MLAYAALQLRSRSADVCDTMNLSTTANPAPALRQRFPASAPGITSRAATDDYPGRLGLQCFKDRITEEEHCPQAYLNSKHRLSGNIEAKRAREKKTVDFGAQTLDAYLTISLGHCRQSALKRVAAASLDMHSCKPSAACISERDMASLSPDKE